MWGRSPRLVSLLLGLFVSQPNQESQGTKAGEFCRAAITTLILKSDASHADSPPSQAKQANHDALHFLPAHLQAGNFHRLHNVFPHASPSGQSLMSSLLNTKWCPVRTISCRLERNLWRENTCTSSEQIIDVVVAQPVFIIPALEFPKSQFVIIPFPAVRYKYQFQHVRELDSLWHLAMETSKTSAVPLDTVLYKYLIHRKLSWDLSLCLKIKYNLQLASAKPVHTYIGIKPSYCQMPCLQNEVVS